MEGFVSNITTNLLQETRDPQKDCARHVEPLNKSNLDSLMAPLSPLVTKIFRYVYFKKLDQNQVTRLTLSMDIVALKLKLF
jgi:hypothetical protein